MKQIERVTPPTLDVLEVLLGADAVWGLLVIKESGRNPGTVYPILDRLERLGWATSEWGDEPERSGPRRKYYALTAEGRDAAAALLAARRGTDPGQLRGAPA
ncbi:PadR family transcriptional regulator [Agromyces mediolanus]|uniref:PadR family transcriptional regulator n=1 Tax=Agromyces mediolanus TaxID=41986 RepID=UPI001E5D9912|nr:PadR family transcriptional regulator [Agromyces mediolanus]MCD1573039.1 PadR family transcriptional regulator [Agromyces mediolanus]